MSNMTETVKVEVELPRDHAAFLKYLFDDNPEENLTDFFEAVVRNEVENIMLGLSEYVRPKFEAMFPGIVPESVKPVRNG